MDFYTAAGIAYRRNNDPEKALQEFEKTLVVYQNDEGIYYNIAREYVERNEWKDEEETILAGLGIYPDSLEGKTLLDYIGRI